jgi:16S rRNA processing protein RimM
MAKTEYFELGYLAKPHGLKGALHVFMDVDDPYEYEDLDAVFVQQGNEMVPFFIEDLQIRENLNLMTLEGITTIDAAKDLVGSKLFLPVAMLPKLKDDQYYYHEIVDYQVKDQHLGSLGTIKDAVSGVATNLGSFSTATESVKGLDAQFQMMSKSMEAMNQYYSKLTEASSAMSSSAQDAVRAKEQISLLADNLTKLNQIYGNMISAMQGRA